MMCGEVAGNPGQLSSWQTGQRLLKCTSHSAQHSNCPTRQNIIKFKNVVIDYWCLVVKRRTSSKLSSIFVSGKL